MKFPTCTTVFASLGVSLLLGQISYADVLIFKNGDRITGEIKKVWNNEITIEPEYSGDLQVDLSAVDSIESEGEFEFELEDGRNIVGRFAGLDASGNQVVSTGEETVSVLLSAIFELDKPESGVDWESKLEFSATLNSGNTDSSNSKLKADATISYPNHRHIGELTLSREELSGVSTQEQDLLKYDYNWLFHERWFFSTKLSFERDPIIQLDHRVIISAGIGLDIWKKPRKNLSMQLGAGAQTEEIGLLTTENGVVTWALRYRQDLLSNGLELYHNNSIAYNVSGRTNTSYKTTTGLRFEVSDLLYANFSIDYDYETHPVDTAQNEDVAILVGVGLEF